MAIKPILFNTDMVRAILNDQKTQTRRIAFKHDDLREFRSNDYPDGWWYAGRVFKSFNDFLRNPQSPRCKYAPGDVLWVRETWVENRNPQSENFGGYEYCADHYEAICQELISWRPSIHMPKEAARIFLRVKDVRVQRLLDMGYDDLASEGLYSWERFISLWDSTINPADEAKYGWNANPWVWAIEFEHCDKPEGWCE